MQLLGKLPHIQFWGETITKVLGALGGITPPDTSETVVRVAAGLFKSGDEANAQRVLLIKNRNGKYVFNERKRALLTTFAEYAFTRYKRRSTVGRVVAWWYINAWGKLLVSMTETSPNVLTTSIITRRNDASEKTQVSEDLNLEKVEDGAVILLEEIIRIIDEHGMNAAITYLESWGIPVVPSERDIENVERWIGSIVDGLQRLGRQTQTLIDASYEAALKKDEKAKKSRLFFWLHFLTK